MIKTGIIGIGRMGGLHAFNIKRRLAGKLRLTAVCDLNQKKLDKYNGSNIATYKDYKEMLDKADIEAVIIATPHYSHCEIARYALEKGIHTLVEKPLAVDTLDAQKTIELAEKHKDTLFMIMFNQRTNNVYIKAKEIIESGKLGKIKRANWIITDWYRSQSYYDQGGWRAKWKSEGGGVLINQCVHQIDIFQWLLGMPKSVRANCKTVNRKITVENDVTAYFEYEDGFNAVLIASTHDMPGTNRLEITGNCGRIIVEKSKLRFDKLLRSEEKVNETTKYGLYGYSPKIRYVYRYGLFKKIRDTFLGQQRNVLKNFSDSILGKAEPIAEGKEGINSLMLFNAIYLSNWENKTINMPLDGKKYVEQLDLHKEK